MTEENNKEKNKGAKAWIEKHLLPQKTIAESSEEYINRYRSQTPKTAGAGIFMGYTSRWRPGKGDRRTLSVPYQK